MIDVICDHLAAIIVAARDLDAVPLDTDPESLPLLDVALATVELSGLRCRLAALGDRLANVTAPVPR